MPKMKTLSAARKRFRVTGTGKVKRKKVGMRHLLSKQRSQKKRDLKRDAFLTGGQKKAVEFMLGIQI